MLHCVSGDFDTPLIVVLILSFHAGGGFPEAKRAFELSQILGINVSPSQVLY